MPLQKRVRRVNALPMNLPTSALLLRTIVAAIVFCRIGLAEAADSAIGSIRFSNNQPFSIRVPIEIQGINVQTASDSFIQSDGTNLVLIADVAAKANREFQLKKQSAQRRDRVVLTTSAGEVQLLVDGKNIGGFSWDLIVEPVRGKSAKDGGSTKRDFAQHFQPIAVAFKKVGSGPVFERYRGTGSKQGVDVTIDIRLFRDGFFDWTAHLTNQTAKTTGVYAALVCRWKHPPLKDQTMCYDNRRTNFPPNTFTGFREDDGRHWHMQHGIDWVLSHPEDGPDIVWVNPFDPSFTVKSEATSKTPARYTSASQAQLAREAQSTPDALYIVTEIARENVRSFRDRVKENVLPQKGEGVSCSGRLYFGERKITDDEADQIFLGYTGLHQQRQTGSAVEITFGVPYVRFGTSYFPYSTLGENFDGISMPGMDRDAFWPLAADTVTQWELFADDIRRDLRLIKWMGFEIIRLHHLELLAPIDKKIRTEYLNFLFKEMRHLNLKVLLDVYAGPEQIVELLNRYGDVIDSVEIENEILIWGIPVDKPAAWKALYAAIKKAAPHVRVHWTGQNNTGIFDRMTALGVPFDRVGLHSYVDSIDAIPSARGWALAAAGYAAKTGKEPVITEWNWRNLTRMSEQERAKVYPEIIEGAVGTRSIPDFYQFQFNETLAPNPRIGRGNILRHYELIDLSRHPKQDAFVLKNIIGRYASPQSGVGKIGVGFTEVKLDQSGSATVTLSVTNISEAPLQLTASIEDPADFRTTITDETSFSLGAHRTKSLTLQVRAKQPVPGFYHSFIRFEGAGDPRYAVIEGHLIGPPKLDLERKSTIAYPNGIAKELGFDLTKIDAVVYGTDAPVIEAETAIAIAQTLESAIGKRIPFYQLDTLPATLRNSGNLILVGTTKSNELLAKATPSLASNETAFVTRGHDASGPIRLAVCGADSESVERAGMDFILRYWLNARASGIHKVGMVEKALPRGLDPTKLP